MNKNKALHLKLSLNCYENVSLKVEVFSLETDTYC